MVSAIAKLQQVVGFANLNIEGRSIKVPIDFRDPYQIDMYARDKQELCVPAVMLRLLEEDGMLLDIGANCGWYSRIVATAFPNATVVALEPSELAFKFLRQFQSPKFFCLPLAASNVDGKRLVCDRKFYRQSSSSAFLETQSEYLGQASCTADSLMCSFGHPSFVKIDVEGAELHVLLGMTELLKSVPYILIEINENSICSKFGYNNIEIYKLMEEAGYICHYDVRNDNNSVTLIKERKTSDVLFCKQPLDWVTV